MITHLLIQVTTALFQKGHLVERADTFKQQKKSPRLPGKKKPKETSYFYRNARALALCAKETELDEEVVAVFFRDSDGTASAGRGLWEDKRDSIIQGFHDEGFERGVPMIPKPKSEAWLICALKNDPYQGCAALEDRSGNDNSPNSLKGEISDLLNGETSREKYCQLVREGVININQIDMPSFRAFPERLEEVI